MKLKELLNPLSDEERKETITEFLKGYNFQENSFYKLKYGLINKGFRIALQERVRPARRIRCREVIKKS